MTDPSGTQVPAQEAARLVEQVVDYAVIGLDATGHIETWNLGAERLKGYSREEAVGLHFSAFYPEEDRRSGLPGQLLARAMTEGRVQQTGWRVRRDGTRFWGDVTITALRDPDGRPSGFVKVTRDLTEMHALERVRQTFLTTLAQDYRGPITAIAGYSELLLDAGAQQEVLVARIRENITRLQRLTDSLLEHAHTETAEVPLHPVSVDVLAVAARAVASLGSLPGVDRVRVGDGPQFATADATALQTMLASIVTNAVRYSGEGVVTVEATRRGDRVLLSVVDRGRGIHPDDLEAVFEAHQRGRLVEEGEGGLGLGLAGVKRLATRQGIRVDLDSTMGEGTVMTLDLPAG